MSLIVETNTVIAFAGLIVAIISIIITYFIAVVKHENRMTRIEENLFTEADRECLHKLDVTVNQFMLPFYRKFTGIIETEFPLVLKHTHTPEFDAIMDKLSKFGIESLSVDEAKQLDIMLSQEIDESIRNEDAGRGVALITYRGVLALVNEQKAGLHPPAGTC